MQRPQEICQKVLDVHEGIRWVKIIDQQGKITFEEKKSYVEPYLSKEAMENLRLLWIEIIRGIIGKVADFWGEPQHMHIQFSKVIVFGFPYMGGTFVATAEANVPLTVICQIQEVLRESYR